MIPALEISAGSPLLFVSPFFKHAFSYMSSKTETETENGINEEMLESENPSNGCNWKKSFEARRSFWVKWSLRVILISFSHLLVLSLDQQGPSIVTIK